MILAYSRDDFGLNRYGGYGSGLGGYGGINRYGGGYGLNSQYYGQPSGFASHMDVRTRYSYFSYLFHW